MVVRTFPILRWILFVILVSQLPRIKYRRPSSPDSNDMWSTCFSSSMSSTKKYISQRNLENGMIQWYSRISFMIWPTALLIWRFWSFCISFWLIFFTNRMVCLNTLRDNDSFALIERISFHEDFSINVLLVYMEQPDSNSFFFFFNLLLPSF